MGTSGRNSLDPGYTLTKIIHKHQLPHRAVEDEDSGEIMVTCCFCRLILPHLLCWLDIYLIKYITPRALVALKARLRGVCPCFMPVKRGIFEAMRHNTNRIGTHTSSSTNMKVKVFSILKSSLAMPPNHLQFLTEEVQSQSSDFFANA